MEEFPLLEWVLNTYNSSWETMCILIGQTHNSLQKHLQSFCVTSSTFACAQKYGCWYLQKHCLPCTTSKIIER